jgi:hypothetical protein
MSETNDATLTFVSGGQSEYQIVIPAKPSASEQRAAEELAYFIKEISGAELPIVSESQGLPAKAILLGRMRLLSEVDVRIAWDWLGEEGFVITTTAPHLVIAGGPVRGTLYGVYTFLETYLGCRWFTPTVNRIPKQKDIAIDTIDEMQVPALAYREDFYYEAKEPNFQERHKINGLVINDHYGGKDQREGILPGFGGWAHTFFRLLSPDEYFETHPEYFSLISGERKASQLCLNNPEVLPIVVANLRKAIEAEPDQKYWTVSQMDNPEPCECETCKALDDAEGTPMASVLNFVNKVADEFPDKSISTLAYWYTVKPPKTIEPRKNVHIMYCTGPNRSRPMETDPLSEVERGYFERWAEVSDEMYIWDYVIRYGSFNTPFPNFSSLGPNMQYFVNHRTTGMLVEGAYSPGGEFAELRAYVIAKLLWNPDADVSAHIDDFLASFYGPAAPMVREYIDVMQAQAESFDIPVITNGGIQPHRDGYLSEEMVAKYNAILDRAEAAVANDPELLTRILHLRLTVRTAEIRLGYGSIERRAALLEELADLARRTGVTCFGDFNEYKTEEYIPMLKENLEKEKAGEKE